MAVFPRRGTVNLKDLKRIVWDVEDSPDLDPRDLPRPLIIDRAEGPLDLIDGMHRAAGMLGWAQAEGIDPGGILVPVIDVTGCDEKLVTKAADAFASGHAAAVAKLHRLAR